MIALDTETVEKPWGFYRRFTLNEPSTVKILGIKAGEEFSLQDHEHRTEFWRILKGNPIVTVGDKELQAKVGDEFTIPEKTHHRVAAPALSESNGGDVEILEISIGVFDEKDIVRLADKYGRV